MNTTLLAQCTDIVSGYMDLLLIRACYALERGEREEFEVLVDECQRCQLILKDIKIHLQTEVYLERITH